MDLKNIESINILKKLVEKSDILVENYIPGKLNSMNLGYDHLKKVNPALIYCSISGNFYKIFKSLKKYQLQRLWVNWTIFKTWWI